MPILRRLLAPSLLVLLLLGVPHSAIAVNVNCPSNGSVTLTNPNPGQLGSSVTAVPSHGVIEQSVSGNPFFVKSVGDPISWSGNSIVNYRNTSAAATDQFSIGGFVFDVTITAGSPPTPTTTTTSDVTITFSANSQAIGVSAHVSPTPPSGSVTFSIPGAGSNTSAVVNPQGNANGTFVVAAGTPSGNYTITATFNGPANYASSFGTAELHVNFFATTTTPANKSTTVSPAAQNLTLNTSVTSQFGGTVNVGTVTFTVMDGSNVLGSPVQSGTVTGNAASASYSLPAGTPAGSYSITADYAAAGNLAPSSGFSTLTVNKTDQIIAFGPLSNVPYGIAPFGLAATGGASGNPVTFSIVSGPGSIVGTTLTVLGAGVITIQADQLGDANYNDGQTTTTQTVTPAPITVTALDQSRAYGASNAGLAFTAAPFVGSDAIATAFSGALASTPPTSPVGTYPITQGTLAAPDYAITFVPGTLTVTPATLTVIADPQYKVSGSPNPPLTYAYGGFVNTDDETVVTGSPALGTTATDVSPTGDYPITVDVGTVAAANYDVSAVDALLHVANAPASQVDAIDAASCEATDLTVHWSRIDGETGPVTYSVYVSEDGGAAAPLVTDTPATSAPFTGVLGKTYGFYSLERDQVGNLEPVPATPDASYTIASCAGNDLAVIKVVLPKTVKLTSKVPARTVKVKVTIQNRSPHSETITDAVMLGKLVHLSVDTVGIACPAPATVLHVGKPQKKLPLTLKSKGKLSVLFDVAIDCANDVAKGVGHGDFRLTARVSHSAFGSGDAHVADDACPRTVTPPKEIDPFPNGKIADKGCGTKKADKTFGDPIVLDVFVKP